MADRRIQAVTARLYRLPLDEPIQDASHGLQVDYEVVIATVTTADGASGTGYTVTIGWGGHAIVAMIENDLKPFLLGKDAGTIEQLYDGMQAMMHYVGRGGIVSFAIAAVDVALWDLKGKVENLPLWKMAGGASSRCKAYRGGVDLNLSAVELVESVRGHLRRGCNAVKVKVGRPIEEDVRRLAAVREALGPDLPLMVDANYSFDLPRAIASAKAYKPFNLVWLEEPLQPDDYAGYGKLAAATGMPLAQGENLHYQQEFEHAFEYCSLAYIQPDAGSAGGVTAFMRVARRAAEKGIAVCSHGMHELCVSLVAAQPNAGYLEIHAFPTDRYTNRLLVLEDGIAVAPEEPGCGVTFNIPMMEEADREVRRKLAH